MLGGLDFVLGGLDFLFELMLSAFVPGRLDEVLNRCFKNVRAARELHFVHDFALEP